MVNNWWIHPIKNKEKIIYFVAAFNVQDEHKQENKLGELKQDISDVQLQLKNQFREIKNM